MTGRALKTAGAPARALLTGLIRVYQATLSGWLGGQCRYYPTCSDYAVEAIRVHGAVKGTGLATWRILRCNPFGTGGIEPVPETRSSEQYDDIIPSIEERAI